MFLKGDIYYRITYSDRRLLYPKIESFVYIGKNLSDEDFEECWYFQFLNSFAKNNSILNSNSGGRTVCILRKNEMEDDMYDLAKLVSVLKETTKARRKVIEKEYRGQP